MNEKLIYKRMNKSDNAITINLRNGYSVMAITGWDCENSIYNTSLFLSKNGYDCWKIIEGAENLQFHANVRTIGPAILKQVSDYLASGFFASHIKRYEFMLACVDSFYKLLDQAQEDDE